MQDFRYDPGSLRDHAARLVAQSEDVVRNFVVVGATTGLFIALSATSGSLLAGAVCGIIGAAAGMVIGDDRRRGMVRDADMALCLVQVEENTRMRDSKGNLVSLATPKERLQKTLPTPEPAPIRQAPVEGAEVSATRRAAPVADATNPGRATKPTPAPAPVPAVPNAYKVIENEQGIPHYAAASETSQVQPAWLASGPHVIGIDTPKPPAPLAEERPAYAAEWPVEEPTRQSVEEHVEFSEPLTASDDVSLASQGSEEEPAPSPNVPRPASMDPEESGLSESEVRGVLQSHDTSFGPSFGSSMWVPDDEEDVEAV